MAGDGRRTLLQGALTEQHSHYGIDKSHTCNYSIEVLLDKGEEGNEEKPMAIAIHTPERQQGKDLRGVLAVLCNRNFQEAHVRK